MEASPIFEVIIGFACIGVINGVFMQETLKVSEQIIGLCQTNSF